MMEFDRMKAQNHADVTETLLRGLETEGARLNSRLRLLQGEIEGARKVIEAKLFLESIVSGRQVAPSAGDAWAAAEADEAIVASAADGAWHVVPAVTGTTFGA